MEHNYQNIFGWFDFDDLYKFMIEVAPPEALFVEIGCFLGKSTSFMGVEIINSKKQIKFVVVDSFQGSPEITAIDPEITKYRLIPGKTMFDIFKHNIKSLEEKGLPHSILRLYSIDAAKTFVNNSIDFCFIDAGHNYEAISADIKAWMPKVKVGGYIGGHDYHETWPDVIKAVKEAFGEDNYEVMRNSWLIKKI